MMRQRSPRDGRRGRPNPTSPAPDVGIINPDQAAESNETGDYIQIVAWLCWRVRRAPDRGKTIGRSFRQHVSVQTDRPVKATQDMSGIARSCRYEPLVFRFPIVGIRPSFVFRVVIV